jgi:pyrroloquinoline quinone (PQQ) biosynthesis protein C
MENSLAETTERHRQKIEALPQLQAMLRGQYSKSSYGKFMIDLYPIVSNFCPLMAAAAGRCADKHAHLRQYLYEHIEHEKGHETMVLTDIEQLGYNPEGLPSKNPAPAAQAMLAYNYFAVDRVDPYCVLGMVYVLELTSAGYGSKVAQSISRAIDHPISRGFTFLDSHATLDDDHLADLNGLIQSIDSTEKIAKIVDSVDMNFYLLTHLISDLPQV